MKICVESTCMHINKWDMVSNNVSPNDMFWTHFKQSVFTLVFWVYLMFGQTRNKSIGYLPWYLYLVLRRLTFKVQQKGFVCYCNILHWKLYHVSQFCLLGTGSSWIFKNWPKNTNIEIGIATWCPFSLVHCQHQPSRKWRCQCTKKTPATDTIILCLSAGPWKHWKTRRGSRYSTGREQVRRDQQDLFIILWLHIFWIELN